MQVIENYATTDITLGSKLVAIQETLKLLDEKITAIAKRLEQLDERLANNTKNNNKTEAKTPTEETPSSSVVAVNPSVAVRTRNFFLRRNQPLPFLADHS